MHSDIVPVMMTRDDPTRRYARLTGVLLLVTFVVSIPAQFVFYEPVLKHATYILGAGADRRVATGALCELVLVIANIGCALILFPVLKRQSEGLALGYLAVRIVESLLILIGVLGLMSVVSLRQAGSGADPAVLLVAGKLLVALHDWTFVLGPGLMAGLGNGVVLGYLLFHSALVPRWMAILGLVGGPLIVLSGCAVLLGLIHAGGVGQAVATIPEFFWELLLGVFLTFRGFRPSAVAALYPPRTEPGGGQALDARVEESVVGSLSNGVVGG